MTELTGILAQIEAKCTQVEMAMDRLRWDPDITMPGVAAEGEDLVTVLLAVRANLDQAETLIREFRRERRRFRAKARERRHEADEAFDHRLDTLGDQALRLEWQSGREREAKARVLTLDARRVARRAENVSALVDDCFEGLKDAFFGLLNVRQELIERLRDRQFETAMERG